MNADQIKAALNDALSKLSKVGADVADNFTQKYGPRLAEIAFSVAQGGEDYTQEDFDVVFTNAKLDALEAGIIATEAGEDTLRAVFVTLLSAAKIVA